MSSLLPFKIQYLKEKSSWLYNPPAGRAKSTVLLKTRILRPKCCMGIKIRQRSTLSNTGNIAVLLKI
jgi:hypothetical protein